MHLESNLDDASHESRRSYKKKLYIVSAINQIESVYESAFILSKVLKYTLLECSADKLEREERIYSCACVRVFV